MYRVINKNKYIERNLCVTLVIYQESLHDARSTKCKTFNFGLPEDGVTNTETCGGGGVIGDKCMYLANYVHLVGIKRSDTARMHGVESLKNPQVWYESSCV